LDRIGGFLVFCAIADKTRNATFHGLFGLFALAFEASFFGRNFGGKKLGPFLQ